MKAWRNVFVILALVLSVRMPTASAFNFNLGAAWRALTEGVGYYGNGADGALTVNGGPNGPTNPYVVNNVTTSLTANAAAGATTLTVSSITGFAAGQEILVIQMEGTTSGVNEFVTISSVAGSTITLSSALKNAYTSANKVQVVVVKRFTTVTINSGGFLTVPAYSSATGTGGVLVLKASTSLVINNGGGGLSGTISVGGGYGTFSARGFAGGASAAGAGPGGGASASNAGGVNMSPGFPGSFIMGAGGGSAANTGGVGGGLIIVKAKAITLDGNIYANGATPATGNAGGGAGGTILVSADTITTTGTCGTISAGKGSGIGTGTAGGDGRIFVNYLTSLGCKTGAPTAVSNYNRFYTK